MGKLIQISIDCKIELTMMLMMLNDAAIPCVGFREENDSWGEWLCVRVRKGGGGKAFSKRGVRE